LQIETTVPTRTIGMLFTMSRQVVRALALLSVCVAIGAVLSAQAPQLGRISFPTSATGAAQAAFVRGVLYLHNFEYDEAILAFREAERLSPSFAMAYWGEALSYAQPLWYNEELGRAREALNRLGPTPAARAAKAPTAREKGYLDAVERLFGPGERGARYRAFADRLELLARDFPDDDEARLLQALGLLATIPENARRPEVSLKAGALAAEVLKRNAQHPGAAHYMLHAYDDGEHNAMALPAARIYARIAPQSSHALHMPSHAFLPLGMWDEAVASDEASFAASVAWVKRTGRTVNQQDFHSLSWLHYEYLQQGRFAKARETASIVSRALAETLKSPGRGAAHPAGTGHMASEIGRGFDADGLRNEIANMRARSIIEGSDWHLMKGASTFGNVDELFALGLSSVANDEYQRADLAVAELRKAASAIPDRDAADVTSIMADEVSAVLSIARGRPDEGLAMLSRAAAREAARPKPIARPYPAKPAGELYAEALAGLGQPAAAVAQYRRALERTPRRSVAVLGLARAAKAAGDNAQARRAAGEFLQIWRAADADRPELAEARALAR
jgi:tetratricopeptide (TPR) repeat protein